MSRRLNCKNHMASYQFTRRQVLSGLGLAATTGVVAGTVTNLNAQEKKNTTPGARSLNVLDFGAAGDGVKDDTSAFVAALKAASNSGSLSVFVPRGHYLIAGNLDIPHSVT